MKRSLQVLSIALVAALLAACGGDDGGDTPVAAKSTAGDIASPEPEETETPAEEPKEPKEPKSDPQAIKELNGTYATSLTLKDVKKAGATDWGINGKYTIEVKSSGYIVPHNDIWEANGGTSMQPAIYTADKKTLSTELYKDFPECSGVDPGVYLWELKDGSLSFALKKDECGLRRALFLTKPWTKA